MTGTLPTISPYLGLTILTWNAKFGTSKHDLFIKKPRESLEAKSLDDSMIMTEGNPEPWRETYTLDENQMHLFPVQTTPQDI